ncbi:MAG: site-2 protease family protein [Candidatus Promineifilaceae bacterium]|jgi:Zn-dependent protease
MNKSLRLFAVKGIDIRVHVTFPLILLWAAYQFGMVFGSLSGALFGIVAISLLFILVTLHELGHSFAARMYDVPVKEIILSPIGGVAQLARMPENPKQEMVIAIAGPAVNFLMAFLIAAVGFVYGLDLFSLTITFSLAESATIAALISYVFISNIFLAAFNLIPAFPMDGGRILRALLALRLNYSKATDIAATIGRIVAILFGIYGLINGGLFMIFIAFFIFMAAGQEAKYSRFKHSLDGYTVQQAYSASAYRLHPTYSLEQAKNLTAYTGQQEFPVVDGEWLTGYLTRSALYQALQSNPSYLPVSSVMDRQILPVTPDMDLFKVQQRLVAESRQSLPVVSKSGHYLGVITHQLIAQLFQQVQTPPIVHGTTSS